MQAVETVLIFVGIPFAVVGTVTGLVYAASSRPYRRYRPGRPFEFAPVWFLAPAEAQPTGHQRKAGGEWPPTDPARRQATGGASDRW